MLFLFVHEIIRGIIFMFAGGVQKKDLSYGFVWKLGAAYCISKVPIRVSRARAALIAPFILVCLPLLIYSIAVGDVLFLIAGALACSVCASGFWYLWKLRKKSGKLYMLEGKPQKSDNKPSCHLLKKIS